MEGIREIADNLWHPDRNVQSDCLKVLYEIGYMAPLVFVVHLVAPLVIATFAGWWQRGLVAGLKASIRAGALFAALNMVALLAWSGALLALRRVQPGPETTAGWGGVLEALHLGLAYVLMGVVLGVVGGLLGAGVATLWHRARGGSGPAAPTAVE